MSPILVLLPGLDGSGELFAPLLKELGGELECLVLPLPSAGSQDQHSLALRLLPLLPQTPFVLLAESFSGAIAVEIATCKPVGLVRIILVATFLQPPRPFLLSLPRSFFKFGWALRRPLAPLWWLFCGERHDKALRESVLAALDRLSWTILFERLRAIKELKLISATPPCPVHIIHARHDWLVPSSVRARLNFMGTPTTVNGPHFLLQSEPKSMAALLKGTLLFSDGG